LGAVSKNGIFSKIKEAAVLNPREQLTYFEEFKARPTPKIGQKDFLETAPKRTVFFQRLP
jgi:hypothetical protein